MAAVSDDSSDSIDEETLRRCQEAVWETKTVKNKDRDNGVQPSRRVIVSDHEHDGNELQVTQGFRKHVAKKLENLLDSVLTVTSSSCVESERRDDDDDDEGFRLFSTSVPGPTTDNGPAPARRQPVPSSSDSDSEMETRLKEAAVSFTDLVPLISSMPSACLENIQKMDDVVDEEEKKKKKKKKRPREGSPPNTNLEQENVRVKVKRKKKKKRDANTEEEAAN